MEVTHLHDTPLRRKLPGAPEDARLRCTAATASHSACCSLVPTLVKRCCDWARAWRASASGGHGGDDFTELMQLTRASNSVRWTMSTIAGVQTPHGGVPHSLQLMTAFMPCMPRKWSTGVPPAERTMSCR